VKTEKKNTGTIAFSFRQVLLYIANKQVKAKFTLEQATKTQKWSRDIALLFLKPRR